jgi:hypothetical protein
MMIIDPVALGDVTISRPSPKWVFDKTGALVQVPAGTFAISYDPADLTKAPYAVVEPAATNLVTASDSLTTGWSGTASVAASGKTYFGRPYQRITKTLSTPFEQLTSNFGAVIGGQTVVLTIALRGDSSANATVGLYDTTGASFGNSGDAQARIVSGPGTITQLTGGAFNVAQLSPVGDTILEIKRTYSSNGTGALLIYPGGTTSTTIGDSIQATRVQIELDRASSYIPTTTAPVTRAADVLGAGSGLVYSNVPITETPYSGSTTYAKDAQVYDPTTYSMYQSLVAGNAGNALSDTSKWVPLQTVVNRWMMLDSYNNTQTSNPEEILIVLSPQALAQGVYIGNADASEVRISCYDPTDGVVYQETQNLIILDTGSSFYNWCFKRIRRRSYAVSVQLPPYYSGLVTILLKKPSGTAKCGMCVVGPLVDVGLSQYGLSREIRDYSTVNFNFDGTSNVVKRNFAKVMDVDVLLDNDMIDSVIESLEGYRQKPVAWIGAAGYGSACLFGTYTSFKNVIQYPTQSAMNLQIQGTV